MNFQDYLQLNLLQQNGNSNQTTKQKLYTFLMMIYMFYQNDFKSIIIKLFEYFKKKYYIKNNVNNFIVKKQLEFDSISLDEREDNLSKVYLTRTYETSNNNNISLELERQMNETIDAIFDFISNLNNIPILELINNGTFVIVYV